MAQDANLKNVLLFIGIAMGAIATIYGIRRAIRSAKATTVKIAKKRLVKHH